MKIVSLLIFLLLFPFVLLAQIDGFFFKNYTTSNGLTYNHIRSIKQDKYGFLWIATWSGLNRFDGYEFKAYYHIPNDTTSIPYFEITNLLVDSSNTIWIQAGGNLCRYNRSTDNFTTINTRNIPTFSADNISGIALDKSGILWVNSDNGLYKYSNKQKSFELYDLVCPDCNKAEIEGQIAFDNTGRLWVGFKYVFKRKNNNSFANVGSYSIDIYKISSNFPSSNYLFSGSFFETRAKRTWLFSNHGLFLLDTAAGKFKEFFGKPPINDFDAKTPLIWGGREGGLSVYYPNKRELIEFGKDKVGFPTAYLIDDQNNIWFSYMLATAQCSGLMHGLKQPDYFTHYLTGSDKKGGTLSVSALTKDADGNLWVGNRNYDHLLVVAKSGSFDSINDIGNHLMAVTKHPRSLAGDGNGTIWIGYFHSLLMKYNEKSKVFTKEIFIEYNDTSSHCPYMFRLVMPLDNQNLLIGSDRFLNIYNQQTKSSRRIELNSQPLSVLRTMDESYWIGGDLGLLFKINQDFTKFESFKICKETEKANIESICEVDSNFLYLTTMGSGICKYNRRDHSTRFFTTADGLPDNVTYEMLSDDNKNLWISTNQGLSKFNTVTSQFENFGKVDGLMIEEFNADAAYKDNEGEMYFGGEGGVVSFHPDSMKSLQINQNHRLFLTEFLVSGKTVHGRINIYELPSVCLQKGDNNFQATFACIDYQNADKLLYRHQLVGIDNEWITTNSKNRRISYAGLSPGSYLLKIEATSSEGNWKYKTQLHITIPPYFYQTNLFRLLVALLVAIIAYLLIRLLIRHTRIQEQRKHEQLKLEALQGQMNPHFIFNSLNSINYFISTSDKISANQYITGFARLIRSILNNSNSLYIPFEKEVESINDYLKLEHLRFSDKFDYEIIIDENLDFNGMEVAPAMVQPFIENAIWHGLRYLENHKGLLKIRFSQNGPIFINCLVEDDGIGRKLSVGRKTEEQKKRRSRGISIIMERLKIMNSMNKADLNIIIEDLHPEREETGTRVTIQVPIKQTTNKIPV